MNKDSKIYLAGHNGLVGSAIWKNLQNKEYTNLIGRSHSELDLMDGAAVKKFFDEEKPEYVILAAAYVGGIIANNTYRADFIYRNLQIQNNVIGESFRHKVKKLLYLGSSCIYPKESPQPIKEEYLLTSSLEYTNEPYAIAKIAGIKMCESYNLQYGTNFLSVMPTNLYGPNDNFDLDNHQTLSTIIRKVHLAKCLQENNWSGIRSDLNRRKLDNLQGTSTVDSSVQTLNKYGIFSSYLELWGSGKRTRDYLWSDDLASASVYLLEYVDFQDLARESEDVRNCHINIGTGQENSIRSLAQVVANVVGYSGRIRFNTLKLDGSTGRLLDISKISSIGWQHEVGIEEGIRRLYQWYIADQSI